ncbi:beta strand repeat-containing protein [Aureimonas sp. AU40]|uniref:beta strand repeat-containing protein n=1 Tax=Aureimonas sp. AU40 TaxID=1637747 RepID=UPI0007859AE8|nr:calcium-binding protein [Aureimonas sp. AU40]
MAQLAFDTQFYLSTYPDVAVAISRGQFTSAQQHYDLYGRFEGRNPNQFFDTTFYLVSNPDVAAARVNPFQHFLTNGAAEGRFATASADTAIDTDNNNRANEFNESAYRTANGDVDAAIKAGQFTSGYQHYVLFGQFEAARTGVPAGGPFTNGNAAPGTGTTVALTLGTDNLVGTNGNDTFVGDYGVSGQISGADSINGGAGIDTVNLFGAATTPTLPQLSNVEALTFTNPAATFAVDVSAISGLTAVGIVNSGSASTFTINANQDVGYINATGGANQAITTTATDTAVTINAYNSTLGTVAVTGAAATTLNVVNNGTGASTLAALTSTADETTINLSGNQGITITGALAGTVTKVDASANSAGVNVTLGASDVSVIGGAGSDKFVFGSTLTTADTIVGGAGTDTVSVVGADYSTVTANGVLAALNTKMSGVEVVEFTGTAATTVNGTTFTNAEVTKLLFNTDAADTIDNAGSARTYAFGDSNTGAATLNLASGNTTVNLSLEATATPTTGGVEVAGISVNANASAPAGQAATINIASIGLGTVVNSTGALSANAGSTFNITGSHDLTIDSLTNGGTINASTFTGKLIATGSAGNDIIIGGSAGDTLNGGAGVDNINGGAGNDIITGGTGADILTGGAGADRFVFAAGDSGLPSATNFDTITDFTKGSDIIDHAAAITFVTNGTASSGVAAINAQGIATFNAADTTLAQQIAAVEAGINAGGAAAAGQTAIFQNGSDSYVFISDGTDGVGANDVLIKLTGVTGLTTSTLTSGDLTLS